jgi:hypothetical protein
LRICASAPDQQLDNAEPFAPSKGLVCRTNLHEPMRMSDAHFPKFVIHRRMHFHELRKAMGTSKFMVLVPLSI